MKTLLKSVIIAIILFGMNVWVNAEEDDTTFKNRPLGTMAPGDSPNASVEKKEQDQTSAQFVSPDKVLPENCPECEAHAAAVKLRDQTVAQQAREMGTRINDAQK